MNLYIFTRLKLFLSFKLLKLKTLRTMKRKVLVKFLLVPVFIFGLAGFSQAQDLNEAAEAFNTASQMSKTDPVAAIASANECLRLCGEIGGDADDIKEKAEKLLPGLHLNSGNALIKAKKISQAVPAFQEALKLAEKYNNEEVMVKSKSMLPKLYNSIATSYYKKEQYDKALENLSQANVYDPDYAKAYYTMGLVYKKMDDAANFETTMEKGIVAATNSKDNKVLGQITKAASTYFLANGTQALADAKAAEAAPLLEKALKFDGEGIDTYFYLASAYVELKKFDEAIELANKALELEGADDEKNARHYYNLGMSYKGKNDKTAACEAFNKALFGPFKENAKYEIEHGIKCGE